MSPLLSIVADLLVGCLLVACIVTSVRLSRRMAAMKADEGAMRQVVTELVLATQKADAAIAGLRTTVMESEQALADRLGAAARHTERLAQEVLAGEAVIERVSRIAAISRRLASEETVAHPPEPSAPTIHVVAPAAPVEPAPGPADSLRAAIRLAREAASRHGRAA